MTYRRLMQIIAAMTEEQKCMDVTILVDDEYYPAKIDFAKQNDTLDEQHPFLAIKE